MSENIQFQKNIVDGWDIYLANVYLTTISSSFSLGMLDNLVTDILEAVDRKFTLTPKRGGDI